MIDILMVYNASQGIDGKNLSKILSIKNSKLYTIQDTGNFKDINWRHRVCNLRNQARFLGNQEYQLWLDSDIELELDILKEMLESMNIRRATYPLCKDPETGVLRNHIGMAALLVPRWANRKIEFRTYREYPTSVACTCFNFVEDLKNVGIDLIHKDHWLTYHKI